MDSNSLPDNLLQEFQKNGYLVIENFLGENEVSEMKCAMDKIVDEMNPSEHPKAIFTTKDDNKHVSDNYFLESVDKIRYFYEEGAFNKSGELSVDRHRALNKVGHALHVLNPAFQKVTFSPKMKNLIKLLGFKDPVVPQSMYIFKQPGFGGEVTPHIDATFLLCHPPQAVVGLWFPIDDATLENGCLWFVPGSHKSIFILNPPNMNPKFYFTRLFAQITHEGICPQTGVKKLVDNTVGRKFVRTHGTEAAMLKFNGNMTPPSDDQFVPAPIKKGGCVVIDGLVWHKSDMNKSQHSRHAYTFHVFDQGSSKWDSDAWLQPTETYQFPRLELN